MSQKNQNQKAVAPAPIANPDAAEDVKALEGNKEAVEAEQAAEEEVAVTEAPKETQASVATEAPAPEPTDAPAPTPTPAPVEVAEVKVAPEAAEAVVSKNIQILNAALENYIEVMNPRRPENVAVFKAQQVSLWNAVHKVAEREDDFIEGMNIILNNFRQHGDSNSVFHAYNVFRGTDVSPLAPEVLVAFQRYVTLLQLAAGSKNFSKLNIDLNKAITEGVFSDDARNRLFAFFGK